MNTKEVFEFFPHDLVHQVFKLSHFGVGVFNDMAPDFSCVQMSEHGTIAHRPDAFSVT